MTWVPGVGKAWETVLVSPVSVAKLFDPSKSQA